jgi:virulence-associated protein VagC
MGMLDSVTTAKIYREGRGQTVRLPEEFPFEGDEVCARWC